MLLAKQLSRYRCVGIEHSTIRYGESLVFPFGVKGGNCALGLSFRRSLPLLLSYEELGSAITLSRNVLFGVTQVTCSVDWSIFYFQVSGAGLWLDLFMGGQDVI